MPAMITWRNARNVYTGRMVAADGRTRDCPDRKIRRFMLRLVDKLG